MRQTVRLTAFNHEPNRTIITATPTGAVCFSGSTGIRLPRLTGHLGDGFIQGICQPNGFKLELLGETAVGTLCHGPLPQGTVTPI